MRELWKLKPWPVDSSRFVKLCSMLAIQKHIEGEKEEDQNSLSSRLRGEGAEIDEYIHK